MPKFEVDCSETRIFEWTVDVEADTEEDAEEIVQKMYDDGELHMMGSDEESLDGLEVGDIRLVDEPEQQAV